MSKKENLRLSSILIRWYEENKRDLPWRDTVDPYIIWISEVILQQTRVDQGLSYFNRFIQRFPAVRDLAEAGEDDVLKLWQGLGYYSRARNLQAAARMIMDEFNGVFPAGYKDVLSLKGVGEYTAAAIVSFSYDQPYAVVDGNVYRVLSRIFAIDTPVDTSKGKKLFSELAQSLLDDARPGLHNQAIMEFGALQCVPVSPDCGNCPASFMCMAYAGRNVGAYPVKEGKQKIRDRYFNYFDIRYGEYMYLHKRTGRDIWQNLYELPLLETEKELSLDDLGGNKGLGNFFEKDKSLFIKHVRNIKHVLSHQVIYASFFQVEINEALTDDKYLRIRVEDAGQYPVSRLVHKYLDEL